MPRSFLRHLSLLLAAITSEHNVIEGDSVKN